MANAWIEHVRRWSAANRVSYMCAVSKPECRAAYQSGKPAKAAKAPKEKAPPKLKLKNPRMQDSATGKVKSRSKKPLSEIIAGPISPVSTIGMYGAGTPVSQQNLTPTFGRTSKVKIASQEMRAKKGKREMQSELLDKFPGYANRNAIIPPTPPASQKTVRVGKTIMVPKSITRPNDVMIQARALKARLEAENAAKKKKPSKKAIDEID